MQDPAIRKAVAYAIDREKLIPTVYEGQGTTAYGLISPRFKRYFVDRKDTPLGYALRPREGEGGARRPAAGTARRRPCTKNGVKAAVRAAHAQLQHASSSAWRSASRPTSAKVGIVIDNSFISDDAINNRIYASGKDKDLYAPNFDAFLWDWDVSGMTPTPIMEVLLSDNASSDSFYAARPTTRR